MFEARATRIFHIADTSLQYIRTFISSATASCIQTELHCECFVERGTVRNVRFYSGLMSK